MDYSAVSNSRKRRSDDAHLENLDAALRETETQLLTSQISEERYILSSGAINSYLNEESEINRDSEDEQIDLIQKAILEEKSCPDILPFQAELYANFAELLENQEQGVKAEKQTIDNKLFLNIYALDIERTKYLLKVYLRIRLFKIQTYAVYILRYRLEGLLSPQENEFLIKYFNLKQNHFKENLLMHLASNYRSLGLTEKHEKPNDEYMVPNPDFDRAVIVRIVKAFSKFSLDATSNNEIDLIPGNIYCFKYRAIKSLHEMGYVEFI